MYYFHNRWTGYNYCRNTAMKFKTMTRLSLTARQSTLLFIILWIQLICSNNNCHVLYCIASYLLLVTMTCNLHGRVVLWYRKERHDRLLVNHALNHIKWNISNYFVLQGFQNEYSQQIIHNAMTRNSPT